MLNSDRIYLRAPEPSDADFMYEVENDADAWRYSDTIAPLSRRILRDYALEYDADPFSAGQLRLIIVRKDSDTPVGIVDLYDLSQRHSRAFIGIYIIPDFRRNGYAAETISLVGRYARATLHLHQLGAKVEVSNETSVRIFSDSGYVNSGILKDWWSSADGRFSDMLLFTKILSDSGGCPARR